MENQVGLVRERFFTPRLRFKTYAEMNAWLLDRCVSHARAHRHPEQGDRTVWEMFEAERPHLVAYAGPFDGFHSHPASVSRTCLVRFDNNKYSVQGAWLKQVVTGFFNYHAVPTNGRALGAFRNHVAELWKRTLRRRSQRTRLTWDRIAKLVRDFLPPPRIAHPWPNQRFAVRHSR